MKVNFIFMSVYSKIKKLYSIKVNWILNSLSKRHRMILCGSQLHTHVSLCKDNKNCFIKFNFIDSVLFYKGKERYSSEINFIGMSVSTKIKSSIRWKSSSVSVYSKIKSYNSWNSTSLACPSIFRYKAVFIRSQFYWHVRPFINKQLYFIEVNFIGIFLPY